MVEKLNAEKQSNAIGRSELAEKFSKNLGETEKEWENFMKISPKFFLEDTKINCRFNTARRKKILKS